MRIGVLGAARIAPMALVRPARGTAEVQVAAVAARDPRRAEKFARRHRIPRALGSYEELIADPDLDAVYIALPNSLHGRWTLAALAAGKHVLCEKPLTANADEAEEVEAAAAASGLVVMEALHYRYHGLIERVRGMLAEGAVGEVTDIEAWLHVPIPERRNIRFDLALGGGALMDTGCYTVDVLRTLAGAEPRVLSAQAKTWEGTGIDVALRARLVFPDGTRGSISCGLRSVRGVPTVRVRGTRGELLVRNFIMPQALHWLTLRTDSTRARSRVPRRPSTFEAQLAAFAGAVLRDEPFPTTVADAVATMRVIDDCYRAAGLAPRSPARS